MMSHSDTTSRQFSNSTRRKLAAGGLVGVYGASLGYLVWFSTAWYCGEMFQGLHGAIEVFFVVTIIAIYTMGVVASIILLITGNSTFRLIGAPGILFVLHAIVMHLLSIP